MSTTASRRKKRFNSDLDSLKVLDFEGPAETGPVPYDNVYDYGPNGVRYLMNCLDFIDNNWFEEGPNEPLSLFEVYKL